MDKEMKAKVDEFLKTNGRRELSLDELDKVSGGSYNILSDGTISINGGKPMTRAEFGNLLYGVAETYGIDIAVSFMRDGVGYNYSRMGHSGNGYSDRDEMGIILSNFWQDNDRHR